MAYFPNGESFDRWSAEYRDRCIHGPEPDGQDCQIISLHWIFNYDQFPEHDKIPERATAVKSMLDTLVPMDGLWAGQCSMFVERV